MELLFLCCYTLTVVGGVLLLDEETIGICAFLIVDRFEHVATLLVVVFVPLLFRFIVSLWS